MKKNFRILLMTAAILFMGVLAAAKIANAEMTNEGFVEVESITNPEPGESLNAVRRIAVLEAYRMLAEEVGELRISSASTLNEYIHEQRALEQTLSAKVDTVVRGAKVKSVYRDEGGAFHAIVRLAVFGGQSSLANAVLPESAVEDFPKPKMTNFESAVDEQTYTGLIIDCSDFDLSTAVTPVIKSAGGEEIYAYKNLARQTVVERGMVGYSESSGAGVQRAGSNPLNVKALFISGECDVVVSDADADKILAANQASKFLNNCLVVFVR